MASKWAKICDRLPRYNGNEPAYQAKVDAVKVEILAPPSDNDLKASADFLEQELRSIAESVDLLQCVLTRQCAGRRYATEFLKAYADVRTIKETLEKHVKSVNLLLKAYVELLIDQYEVEGSSSVKLSDGTSGRVGYEPYSVVENRADYRAWCLKNGYENEMMLSWQTTNGIVKELLEAGEPEPPGIKVFTNPKITLTRG